MWIPSNAAGNGALRMCTNAYRLCNMNSSIPSHSFKLKSNCLDGDPIKRRRKWRPHNGYQCFQSVEYEQLSSHPQFQVEIKLSRCGSHQTPQDMGPSECVPM